MTIDREHLQRWYKQAMERRLMELRDLREGLRSGEASALDGARRVAQALRGSGATFGFPELSTAAGLVESAPDRVVLRRVEGLIEDLRALARIDEGEGGVAGEWLAVAAGLEPDVSQVFESLEEAWAWAVDQSSLDFARLSERAADLLGVVVADLSKSGNAALRLVPEALIRSESVLPLGEDSETITVATSDPTALELEMRLAQITGRTPVFQVAAPESIRRAIVEILDAAGPAVPSDGPRPRAPRPVGQTVDDERILVVDDEPAARLLARNVLEKGGYSVDEASDGMEALDRLEARPTALVVADLNMPRLDGLELIWEMRSNDDWAHVPVIVVTGERDEILETKLIEEGADDYIRKPLDPRLFLARVAATIRRTEP